MKKINLLIILYFMILVNCSAQNDNSFGQYYRIGEYTIKVPFADLPHITPKQNIKVGTMLGYQYTYPDPKDDLNNLYGIDVIEIQNNSSCENTMQKLRLIALINKMAYETYAKGLMIKEDQIVFRGDIGIRQKMRINIPDVGEEYVNSIIMFYKNIVVRIYTFTPIENDENIRINNFFDAIVFE